MSATTFLPRRAHVLFLFASQVAISTVALAQQPQNWDLCTGKTNPTFEQRISACTAIVEAKDETPANRANALGNRAVAYANNDNIESAIRDYEESLLLDATSASSHRFRGNKYVIEKSYADALGEYSEAIRLDPTDAFAFTNRGRVYVVLKDYVRAINDYNEAIRLDPNLATAYYGRGRAHYLAKVYDTAIADVDRAIQLNPRFSFAFIVRASAFQAKGDYRQAVADYDQAIQLNPNSAVAYAGRCGNRIAAGQDLHAALSDCNEALRLQPRQSVAVTNRGFIHLKLSDTTQATTDFDTALTIDANDVWSLYGRGLAKWEKGHESDAQADITAAKKKRPDIIRAVAKYYGLTPKHSLLWRLFNANAKEYPMTFVIAHGDADACGAGCNEWIAADGVFDQDAEKRFRSFLDSLHGRKLPIFFNSSGGFMRRALAIGRVLRERKMAAGIGITVPEDCRAENVREESCRHLLRTNNSLKAKLRTAGAICNSACVLAFIGAYARQIPEGAIVGVHAPLQAEPSAKSRRSAPAVEQRDRAERRQYTKQMGVDPDLIEFGDRTPYINMHILTRDEISRYQVETTPR